MLTLNWLMRLKDYSVINVVASTEMEAHEKVREWTDGECSGDVIEVAVK